jgi:hypothetical protein
MSTSEWFGQVRLIERVVVHCKAEIAKTKSTIDRKTQYRLRMLMTTLCHNVIAIIGRLEWRDYYDYGWKFITRM